MRASPKLTRTPSCLVPCSENDITDVLENTFSAEDDRFGETVTIDLKPDGQHIEVTNDNKKEYVQLIVEWRIQRRVEDQFKAFLSGFNELIPQELINVFDERELELLIGGMSEIDVDDWQKHTDYRGYQQTDEVVQWFWKVRPAFSLPLSLVVAPVEPRLLPPFGPS